MEIGIDSFAARFTAPGMPALDGETAIAQLLGRIEYADKAGLDVFGI
jgi:hypothetical protein